MPKRCVVFSGPGASSAVSAVQSAANALLGFPRQESEATAHRKGSGRHTPWEKVVTERHAWPLKHPTKSEYAYPIDALIEALDGQSVTVTVGGKSYTLTVSVADGVVTLTVNGVSVTEQLASLDEWAVEGA